MDTGSNPADDASRGLSAKELCCSKRWICGPDFLWKEESSWPQQQNVVRDVAEDDPEVKREAKTAVVTTQAAGLPHLSHLPHLPGVPQLHVNRP